SIRRDIDAMQVRFLVQNDPPHADDGSGAPIEVILESLETPDLFKDGAEVVVEGRMVASSAGPVFEADKIMAKCPSKFEAEPMGSTES
ncbi:MAG: cytochrome c maturation protein CcmE, partial [Deltaproteobacteria bacterium]|nr:cytochrome c maturation protein CcmE [Deltaproteobacteria bacterium]